jgi:hypothetical protein
MIAKEESKVGAVLGIIGGCIIFASIPISFVLLSRIYSISIGEMLEYTFSFVDRYAILVAVGVILNFLFGLLCMVLGLVIYVKNGEPGAKPYIISSAIFGIVAMVLSIIIIGGLIGLLGGVLCLVGGYLALREIHEIPSPEEYEMLKDQFVCERCGNEISTDDVFCENCGVRFA